MMGSDWQDRIRQDYIYSIVTEGSLYNMWDLQRNVKQRLQELDDKWDFLPMEILQDVSRIENDLLAS